jgi:hypothetical protein
MRFLRLGAWKPFTFDFACIEDDLDDRKQFILFWPWKLVFVAFTANYGIDRAKKYNALTTPWALGIDATPNECQTSTSSSLDASRFTLEDWRRRAITTDRK